MDQSNFPMFESVSYFVEERHANNPTVVSFAWCFDNKEDAKQMLLGQVDLHGHDRFYTAYIHIG